MAELQTLKHGELNWDKKVNALINAVNGLKWSHATSDGLVFQNGFESPHSTDTWYRYIQFDGWKLVDLQIEVTLPTAPADKNWRVAVQLPDAISYAGYNEWMTSSKYQMTLNDTDFHISPVNSNDWWAGAGSHYVTHVLYVHVD